MNLSILKLKTWLIDAKKDLNGLKEIKSVEIVKHKDCTPRHKKVLNLFNDLSDIILTDKTSENQENENEKVESRKEKNEDDDYKYENEDEDDYYENENKYENENGDDVETMD